MNAFSALVIIGVFVGFAVAVVVTAKSRRAHYERLARRYRGVLESGSMFRSPRVRFSHQGTLVRVDVQSGGDESPDYLQVHFPWPDRKFRCEVHPAGFLSQIGKFFGMQDLEIGSPQFDEDYVIKGNNLAELRRLLSPEVQRAINALRACHAPRDINVSIKGGELLVKKPMRSHSLLEPFVELALRLHKAATGTIVTGITFSDEGDAELDLAEGVCRVCGEALRGDVVCCLRCDSPHHRECWDYCGGCSTYGCGETECSSAGRIDP